MTVFPSLTYFFISGLQFDNVARVFKIFSDALNMAPPYFPSFQSPSTNLLSSTTVMNNNHDTVTLAPSLTATSMIAPPPTAKVLPSSTNANHKG